MKLARGTVISEVDAGEEQEKFRLTSETANEAMNLLGITSDQLELKSFQQFYNGKNTEEEAKILHQKYLMKRKQMIVDIKAKEEELREKMKEKKKEPGKIDGDVVHERYLIDLNNQQLKEAENQNQIILKRIAIQQLRNICKQKKSEACSARVERLQTAQLERSHQIRMNAQSLAEKTSFQPKTCPGSARDLLFTAKQPKTIRIEDNLKRYAALRDEEHKKYLASTQKMHQEAERALKQVDDIVQNNVENARKKVKRVEENLSRVPDQKKQIEDQLNKRAQDYQNKANEVNTKKNEILNTKVNKIQKALDTKFANSVKVLEQNNSELSKKINAEKQILEKRNEEAEKIFQSQKERIEDKRRYFSKRDIDTLQRLDSMQKSQRNKYFELMMEHEEKVEEVRRAARAREQEAAYEIAQKTARNSQQVAELRAQKEKAQFAKVKAAEAFNIQRAQLMRMSETMANYNDNELINSLMAMLNLTEGEARNMLQTAKSPRSLHERSA